LCALCLLTLLCNVGNCVSCQREKKTLESLRLDLDAAKTKLRRAKTQPGKDTVSNSSLLFTSPDDFACLLLRFELRPSYATTTNKFLMYPVVIYSLLWMSWLSLLDVMVTQFYWCRESLVYDITNSQTDAMILYTVNTVTIHVGDIIGELA